MTRARWEKPRDLHVSDSLAHTLLGLDSNAQAVLHHPIPAVYRYFEVCHVLTTTSRVILSSITLADVRQTLPCCHLIVKPGSKLVVRLIQPANHCLLCSKI